VKQTQEKVESYTTHGEVSPTTSAKTSQKDQRIVASPLAKKTAREHGIDLHNVNGTGPSGRIIQVDVLEAKKKPVEAPTVSTPKTTVSTVPTTTPPSTTKVTPPTQVSTSEYEDIEITSVRKVIAERLAYSKSNIPHFYIAIECNVDKLNTLRNELNNHSPVKLSVNDLIIKAASLACLKVPETNSSWQGNSIRKYKNVDMSVAVQTEFGLITPIIPSSNLKGLAQISKEMKDLSERARARKLKPQEFQGGTFTISNMGMLGVSNFSAVINPPQVNIFLIYRHVY
jgi:pyruvate dehydrogenase E2 component (dihydrolipoamide acetyltransferase)